MKFKVSHGWSSSKGEPLIEIEIDDSSNCGVLCFTHEIAFRLRVSDFSYFDGDIIACGSWNNYTEKEMDTEYPGMIEEVVNTLKENPNMIEGEVKLCHTPF